MKYLLIMLALCSAQAETLEGYDYKKETYVSISEQPVAENKPVEYYDYNSNSYNTGNVVEVKEYESRTEVVVYDSTTNEYRTFELNE